jgi:hypothetical protein
MTLEFPLAPLEEGRQVTVYKRDRGERGTCYEISVDVGVALVHAVGLQPGLVAAAYREQVNRGIAAPEVRVLPFSSAKQTASRPT